MTVFLDLFGTRTDRGTPLRNKIEYNCHNLEELEKVLIEKRFHLDPNDSLKHCIKRYHRLKDGVDICVNIIHDFVKYQTWIESLKEPGFAQNKEQIDEFDKSNSNDIDNLEHVKIAFAFEIIPYSEQFKNANFEEFCKKCAIHNQFYFNGFLSIFLSLKDNTLTRYTKLPRYHAKKFHVILDELFKVLEVKNNAD